MLRDLGVLLDWPSLCEPSENGNDARFQVHSTVVQPCEYVQKRCSWLLNVVQI